MRNTWGRFDKIYLLVAPAVLLTFFVPLRMRVGNWMVVPFILMWLFVALAQNERPAIRLKQSFLRFFVPITFFMLIRGTLQALAWGDDPLHSARSELIQNMLYSGLVCFYMYLFNFMAVRRKYKELMFLNVIIILSLGYGSLAYLRYDVGAYRHQKVGAFGETVDQMINRLEMGSSGLANYGCAYGMLMINVLLAGYIRNVTLKYKIIYLFVMMIFTFGIYKGGWSTATAIVLMGIAMVMLARLLKIRQSKCHLLIIPCVIGFVLIVAFPSILYPLAGLFRAMARAMPQDSDYGLRLLSLSEAFSGYKDTYAVERAELYWNSIKIFFHNPVFGIRANQVFFHKDLNFTIHGHSFFFDTFAVGGIILGGMMVYGFYQYYQYLKKLYALAGLPRDMLYGWLFAFWSIVIVACINQSGHFETYVIFFFTIPSIPFFNYDLHMKRSDMQSVCHRFPAAMPPPTYYG